jgi:pimeloyl-ACP methyl ester carboxylesterase
VVDLRFRSGYEPFLPDWREAHARCAENLVAHARWFRSPRPRATIVCLHGLGGGRYALDERAFAARGWLRLGWDVVLVQLPYHGRRRPRGAPLGAALFPSPNVVRTNEAFAQTVHDVRALLGWLRDRDVPAAGLFGMSLGGYAAALLAGIDPDLAFVVPIIPAVSMADLMWRHGEGSPAPRRSERAGVELALLERVFRVHSPLARPARVPRDRLAIVAGRADRITPPDQARALWQHWGRPEIHWFPGGHLAQLGRREALRGIARWLGGVAPP